MITRRDTIRGLTSFTFSGGGALLTAQANAEQNNIGLLSKAVVSSQKNFLPLPSMGNTIGRALSGAVYLTLAAAAPAALVAIFSSFIVTRSINNANRASKDYIDFRMQSVQEDVAELNRTVRQDIEADEYSFHILEARLMSAFETLRRLLEDDSLRISEVRELQNSMRKDLEFLRLEGDRASTSVTVYNVTSERVRNSRYAHDEFIREPAERAERVARKLVNSIENIRDFVFRW